jgi:hypothetical protein
MRNIVLATALALIVGILAKESTAEAATRSGCIVNTVQYDNGRIAVWCNGDSVIYYAFTSHPFCGTQSLDTLKLWLPIFESAILSGKKVDFDYNAPAGSCIDRNISSVRLQRL